MKIIFVLLIMVTVSSPQSETAPHPLAAAFYETQESVDNGHQPWRINPEEVAQEFAARTLGFAGESVLSRESGESARVNFFKKDGTEIHIDLYQPARKGQGGIWEVDHWFNEDSKMYQVRDLSALPPLFYNDVNVPLPVREAVRDILVKDFTETFGKYYNVLGFYATEVDYSEGTDSAGMTFNMTLVTRNFYKNPDTVEYIKQAKESGSKHYQTLYDEYNMPRSANVNLKATMTLAANGEVLPESIELFNNISVTSGPEYVPLRASDFIISD